MLNVSRSRGFERRPQWIRSVAAASVVLCLGWNGRASAESAPRPPVWHALLVGVGDPAAKGGATADITELAGVLGRNGVRDLDVDKSGQLDRATLLRKLDDLVARTNSGDEVAFAFCGLGRGAPGRSPELALSAAAPDGPGRHLDLDDLARFMRRVEARNGRALVVVDAAFGSTIVRNHRADPAAPNAPVQTGSLVEAMLPAPSERSVLLTASDPRFRTGAIAVPGQNRPRHLLTYAVGRALGGDADFDHDGTVSTAEIVTYTAPIVYQLSDGRQRIQAVLPTALTAASDDRAHRTRGLADTPTPDALAPSTRKMLPLLTPAPEGRADAASAPVGPPVTLAATTGGEDQLARRGRSDAPVKTVARDAAPDLLWDPASRDVIDGDGDLVAQAVGLDMLGGVVDRTQAVRELKQLAMAGPQSIDVSPNDEVHKPGSVVAVKVGNAAARSLILFNIRGDGTIEFLYPRLNDPEVIRDTDFTLKLLVNGHLGTDQIVAVTDAQSMDELRRGLMALNDRTSPLKAVSLIRSASRPGMLVGTAGVFSGGP